MYRRVLKTMYIHTVLYMYIQCIYRCHVGIVELKNISSVKL